MFSTDPAGVDIAQVAHVKDQILLSDQAFRELAMNARGLRGDQTPRTWSTACPSFRCDITWAVVLMGLGCRKDPGAVK